MENYVYKQNTGVLSRNQRIIVEASTSFIIKGKTPICNNTCIRYNYYKCNDCYRLEVYLDEQIKNHRLVLTPSTCDYQIWVYLNKKYVYKDRGSVGIDLSNVTNNILIIDLKIKKGTAISLVLEDSNCNNKIVSFK